MTFRECWADALAEEVFYATQVVVHPGLYERREIERAEHIRRIAGPGSCSDMSSIALPPDWLEDEDYMDAYNEKLAFVERKLSEYRQEMRLCLDPSMDEYPDAAERDIRVYFALFQDCTWERSVLKGIMLKWEEVNSPGWEDGDNTDSE